MEWLILWQQMLLKKQLNNFKDKLNSKNVEIEFSEECVNHIAKIGTSEEFGAREIARVIASNIKPLLVDEILFGKLSEGGKCVIDFCKWKIWVKDQLNLLKVMWFIIIYAKINVKES